MKSIAVLGCLVFLTGRGLADEVAVRVTANGKPVPGTDVMVLKPGQALVFDRAKWKPVARTDAEGIAVVQLPSGGRVVVHREGDALAIAHATGPTVDLELRDEWPFFGTAKDEGGKPVAGADVYLRMKRTPATLHVRSDAKGRFAFAGVWLDDYTLRIEADGFLAEELDWLTEKDSGRAFALSRPATLVVTVADKKKASLADWPLRCGEARLRTDANGRARFEMLRPGEVVLAADRPFVLVGPLDYELADGETKTIAVRGVSPAWVRATLASRGGVKLQDVRVVLNGAPFEANADGTRAGRTEAGAAGVIEVEAKDHLPATFRFLAPGAGGVIDLGELVLDVHPRGRVIVRAPDGGAAPNGKAHSLVGEPVAFEKGAVVLPTGDWEIRVPGFPVAEVAVVSPGPVHVTLPRPLFIEGRVVNGADEAVAGAVVLWAGGRVVTDARGVFRIEPLADKPTFLVAQLGMAHARLDLRPGPGTVTLRLEERRIETIRGRVLDRGRPVLRFSIMGKEVLDEDGRFEIPLDRRAARSIVVEAFGESHFYALPEPGRELIARLPEGAIHASVAGGPAGTTIALRTVAGEPERYEQTGADGLARFRRLGPGRYVLEAEGFAPQPCTVGAGDPVVVILRPRDKSNWGRVRIRWPGGKETIEHGPAGIHKSEAGYMRIVAGEERLIDWTVDAGELVVRGRPWSVTLKRDWPDARLLWFVFVRPDVIRLGAGRYRVVAGAARRTVTVRAGERTVLDLAGGGHDVRGRVLDRAGQPVPGAYVELLAGDAYDDWPGMGPGDRANVAGQFRFTGVLPGRYECRASANGYAPAISRVIVADDGIAEDGFPLVLKPSVRARVRVVDPTGAPTPGVIVRTKTLRVTTDALGYAELPESPMVADIAVLGFGRIRRKTVQDGDVLKLVTGADLRILSAGKATGRMTLEIGGARWDWEPDPLARGRVDLTDLPVGQARLIIAPEPDSGDSPREFRFRLRPGQRSTVDLNR